MKPELYNAAIYGSPDFRAKFEASSESDDDEQEITFTCGQNNTILHVAAKSGMLQIEEGDDHVLRFLYAQNKKGDTPLHIAAKMGHLGMTKILVDIARETDVEQNRKLLTMVNMNKDTALHEAVRGNHLEVVKLLIEEDEGLASLENGAGESPLFIAVDRCFFPVAFHILDTAPNCSFVGSNGMNVLHAAVIRSRSWKVYSLGLTVFYEIMISKIGLLFNRRIAYKYSNNDQYLVVDYGKSCSNHRNTDKRDIVDVVVLEIGRRQCNSIMEKADEFGWIPLHYAAYIGNKKAVDMLMDSSSNTSLARNKQGMSALHLSAEKGHVDVITTLIQKCPEVCELLDNNDRTALHVAVEYRKKNVVKFLLQSSVARPFQDLVNEKDNINGNTALHLAAASTNIRDFAILEMLAHDPKVDKGALNKEGMTFIDILMLSNDKELVRNQWEIVSWLKRDVCLPTLAQKWGRSESRMNTPRVHVDDKADIKGCNASSSSSSATGQEQTYENGTNRIKDMSQTYFWISSIIATVTFAAAVQVPGGNDDKSGLAILRKSKDFHDFLFNDAMAFVFACVTMGIYLCNAIFFKKTSLLRASAISVVVNSLILASLIAMMFAFIKGIAAVVGAKEPDQLLEYNFVSDTAVRGFSALISCYLAIVLLSKSRVFKVILEYLYRKLEAILLRLGFHGILEESLRTYVT